MRYLSFLNASAFALLTATTLLLPKTASAAPTVTLSSPSATAVPDSVVVRVTTTDALAISSVTASIGGVAAPMRAQIDNEWTATLDIAALPLGPATLQVVATNGAGESTTLQKAVIHDHAPTITVATPDGSAAVPKLRLAATCTKADTVYPCASVTVSIDGKQVASGSPALDQTVSLAAYDKRLVNLTFAAIDTAGMTTTQTVKAYVEASPNLAKIDEVDGALLDADATRLLYVGASGVTVKDRTSGAVTVLDTFKPESGRLFDGGAAWPGAIVNGRIVLGGVWRNGTVTARANDMITGDWAVSAEKISSAGGIKDRIVRENLVTGVVDMLDMPKESVARIAIDAAGNIAFANEVTLNGTLRLGVYRIPVGTAAPGTLLAANGWLPLIDGDSVVFHSFRSNVDSRQADMLLWTPAAVKSLGAGTQVGLPSATPFVDYRMTGGWIGYTATSGSDRVVWTRAPDGTQRLASPYAKATVAGLNEKGEVVVDHPGGRAISSAGSTNPTKALDIGGASGAMRWFGGVWYVIKGRSLFRVGVGINPEGMANPGEGDGANNGNGNGAPAAPAANDPPTNGGPNEEAADGSCALSPSSFSNQHGAGALAALGLIIGVAARRRRRSGVLARGSQRS